MASKRKSDGTSPAVDKTKAAKRSQKFLDKYSSLPGITASKKGEYYAFCSYCKLDFYIRHSGQFDITRHMGSKGHENNVKTATVNSSIVAFMPQQNVTQCEKAVIKAEALMTEFIVSMNLPLSCADTFSQLVKTAFADSKIAHKYECGRSKTTAIVKELAAMRKEDVIGRMKTAPFSIATDGSNDQREKQFPIVVTTTSESGIHTDLLGVPVLKSAATGENIFKLLDHELKERNVPWTNCLAFGTDNANVMIGRKKGVFSFIVEQQPSIYLSGCPCHLIHHAAEKAANALPFSIDEILVDTYYFLDKSSKRQSELEVFQKLYDVNHTKILKHVQTRWLSIGRCLDRILENWDALKVFFVEQKSTVTSENNYRNKKISSLELFFKSPTNRLYCLFLQNAIIPFDKLNTTLQGEKPLIHSLRRLLHELMRELLIRFVVPRALHGKSVTKVTFDLSANHKEAKDLIIGDLARNFIFRKEENHLRDSRLTEFYDVVKKFFTNACNYIKTKLPLDEELLKRAEVVDIDLQLHNCNSDLLYFLDRFPGIIPEGCTKEKVLLEYARYQSDDVTVVKKGSTEETWVAISKMKDTEGVTIYPNLPKVMFSIMSIPHSNAQCERIFSCVRKNKTDQRASLSGETLDALMVVKSKGKISKNTNYSDSELIRIKSAYYRQLKKF